MDNQRNLIMDDYTRQKVLRKYCLSVMHNFACNVKVVIFAGGKFRENVGKTFNVGVFSQYYFIFLHKGIRALFSSGVNFCKEDKSVKNAKITPTRKFPCLQ